MVKLLMYCKCLFLSESLNIGKHAHIWHMKAGLSGEINVTVLIFYPIENLTIERWPGKQLRESGTDVLDLNVMLNAAKTK